MKLDYTIVNSGYRYYNKIKYLFEHAFPTEERPPFMRFLEMRKNKFYGVEDSGDFIGLVSIVDRDDLAYIFFLAVKKRYRGKGYGSQILHDILLQYSGKRVFLMVEDPTIPCDNKEERDNRIRFYSHNGFFMSDVKIIEYGVEYVVLVNNGEVSKAEFLSLMEYLLDDYYPIYCKFVK